MSPAPVVGLSVTWAGAAGGLRAISRAARRRPSLWLTEGRESDSTQYCYPVDIVTEEGHVELPVVFDTPEQAAWVAARLIVAIADLREPPGYPG